MPLLEQADIDEFLSTTIDGLFKADKSVTQNQFLLRQRELLDVLYHERHLTQLKSSKTGASLLHCAASNNAVELGQFLIDEVNNVIFKYADGETDNTDYFADEFDFHDSVASTLNNHSGGISASTIKGARSASNSPKRASQLTRQHSNSPKRASQYYPGATINARNSANNTHTLVGGGISIHSQDHGSVSSPGQYTGTGGLSPTGQALEIDTIAGNKNVMVSGQTGATSSSPGGNSPTSGGSPKGRRKKEIPVIIKSAENYEPHGQDFTDLIEYTELSRMTPLHFASFEGNLEFIDLLCDAGADLIAKDQLGQTPLHWAVQGGEHEACALLLQWERGAQALCLSDRLGQTPVDLARLFDRKFLHIRNHRSLLEVLAREYTDIRIPKVGFLYRQDKKASFLKNNPKTYANELNEQITLTREQKFFQRQGNKKKTKRVFNDIDGPWLP